MLFAERMDGAEKLAVPVGVAIGLVLLFATKSGRKSINNGCAAGQALRARRTGKLPEQGGKPRRRPTVGERSG